MWNEKSLHDFALQIERLARFFRFLHRWKCWVFFPSNGMPILRWRHGCWGARRAKGRLGGERTFPASQPWHTQPCREVALRRTTPTSVIDDFIWNHYLISRSHVLSLSSMKGIHRLPCALAIKLSSIVLLLLFQCSFKLPKICSCSPRNPQMELEAFECWTFEAAGCEPFASIKSPSDILTLMCFLLCLHIAQINFCGKETETNFQLVTTEEKFLLTFQ